MKYIVHIVVLCLLFVGCGRNTGIDRQLAEVERLIEVAPDSAMAIIEAIDAEGLSGREQKAHYAILKSMALDKNYIDTTTFDVLQPAIDYYLEHGTPNEKLRTLYYQGIIFQNQKNREEAMNSFIKALDISHDYSDSLVIARSLVALGLLYNELYDYDKYVSYSLKASDIYNRQSIHDKELRCLFNALNGAILLGQQSLGDSILCHIRTLPYLDSISRRSLSRYELAYTSKFGTPDDIQKLINEHGGNLNSHQDLFNLAISYNTINQHDKAIQILDFVKNSGQPYDTLRHISISVTALDGIGNYKDALKAYKKFTLIMDSITIKKFELLTQTIQSRNKIELQVQKDKEKNTRIIWGCVGGIVVLVLGVVILFLLVRSNKAKKEIAIQKIKIKEAENAQLKSEGERLALEKGQLELENKNLQLERDNKALEAENLAHRVETLEIESENLKSLMESQEELPSEVQDAIKVRIEMLNSLLAGYITANEQYEKPYDVWVRELTANTEEFMNSNRLAFQASHPRFIQYFEDHGLTVDEINYVCLYAIGLRGKEVGNYMKKRSHVNTSSAIRKKLGIDKHETNIGIYVRKLLRAL